MSAEIIFVYTTWPDEAAATKCAHQLIELKLAACANLTQNMKSIYRWQGKIQSDNEVVLILKTKKQNFPKIEEKLQALHPYECPCIVALPVEDASASYLQWIDKETV